MGLPNRGMALATKKPTVPLPGLRPGLMSEQLTVTLYHRLKNRNSKLEFWEVETWTKTCRLPARCNFEPHFSGRPVLLDPVSSMFVSQNIWNPQTESTPKHRERSPKLAHFFSLTWFRTKTILLQRPPKVSPKFCP